MALTDIFKVNQFKQELTNLKQENDNLKKLLTPEMQEAVNIQAEIERLQEKVTSTNDQLNNLQQSISKKQQEFSELATIIKKKKEEIVELDEEALLQEFGLYKPQYEFTKADEYKNRLVKIRDDQKALIKSDRATTGAKNWQVNGSVSQGTKMVKDTQKLFLRAFNSECDEIVSKVKYNNYDSSEKRMRSSCAAISKLGKIMDISITDQYLNLKIQELRLALEYQLKKQEEKEALKAAREEMREAAKLQKEIDEQRKKIEKEQSHYQKALINVIKQLENASEEEKDALIEKRQELENELGMIATSLQDIDYREANQKAGYVYVISNVGAFGENVYKIGMTRRLDPQERIDELGDASVPFDFDVHAMIFTDDAPKLEAALHKAFDNKKLNMVNTRREFFNVSLDEIKEVVKKNYDKTVEFTDTADAEQYRISLKIKNGGGLNG